MGRHFLDRGYFWMGNWWSLQMLQVRHPPGCRPDAGTYERAPGGDRNRLWYARRNGCRKPGISSDRPGHLVGACDVVNPAAIEVAQKTIWCWQCHIFCLACYYRRTEVTHARLHHPTSSHSIRFNRKAQLKKHQNIFAVFKSKCNNSFMVWLLLNLSIEWKNLRTKPSLTIALRKFV